MMTVNWLNRCPRTRLLAPVTTLLLLFGCANQTPPAKVTEIEQHHLAFVRDGSTTREQALLQLGIPSGQFEGERIMSWRLRYDGKALHPVAAERAWEDPRYTVWNGPTYNLVLVFDLSTTLQRHSFIEVR
jgi:hypothetical protein